MPPTIMTTAARTPTAIPSPVVELEFPPERAVHNTREQGRLGCLGIDYFKSCTPLQSRRTGFADTMGLPH